MLIAALVFLVLAAIAAVAHYSGLAISALLFSESFLYIYLAGALLASVLHVSRRPKNPPPPKPNH